MSACKGVLHTQLGFQKAARVAYCTCTARARSSENTKVGLNPRGMYTFFMCARALHRCYASATRAHYRRTPGSFAVEHFELNEPLKFCISPCSFAETRCHADRRLLPEKIQKRPATALGNAFFSWPHRRALRCDQRLVEVCKAQIWVVGGPELQKFPKLSPAHVAAQR